MPTPQENNGYVPPVKHAEKAAKQKTLAAEQITSLAQIDFSKPLSQEELAVVNYFQEQEKESGEPRLGTAEKEAKTEGKEAKPEEKAEQYISSIVGAYAQSKEESVNMGADIAFVQKHLLRLGIMDSLTYKAEMITGGGQHKAEQITQTIKAIYYFQESVMGWGGDGYAKPDGGTIKYLATFTREEVIKREAKIKAKNASKAAANEKETKVEKDKQKELAQQVHDAIYGIGTDEEAVYQALMQLNKNDAKIKEFRELYASTFKADLVNDIEWDFSGKEEAKALGLLNITDEKEKEEEKGKIKDKFKTVEPIIKTDDYRSQSPKATSGVKDSEPGWENCKFVAEKMVYRQLYGDLSSDFKRSDVTNESTGKYKHVVGNVGKGEFLSVLSEDKNEYKNIEEGVHKQSTFIKSEAKNQALDYLDKYLDEGIAVVVGVDHTFNRTLDDDYGKTTSKYTRGYNEGTTDHFIVVVGKGLTKNGKKYYQFYDPGTSYKSTGTKSGNKLIENEKDQFEGKQPWGNKKYHLTMVLLFKKDTLEFTNEINKNISNENQLDNDFSRKEGSFKK